MASSKVPLLITYRAPGVTPPVFVAASFPSGKSQPKEMELTEDKNSEPVFKTEVLVEPGSKVQYRFRIGTGDRWVLDKDVPTVTDDAGNQYNVVDSPQGTAKPLPKAVTEILNRSAPQSGASTPTMARNAAEVADSAAILDKEDSEPEMPDEEAGRQGFRRLSSTPITEVANTAAEVAGTAEVLDAEEAAAPELVLRPVRYEDDTDQWDSNNLFQNQGGTPLFAHECAGMYQPGQDAESYDSRDSIQDNSSEYFHSYTIDPNDPTLERFPSNWEGIANTVRKLEGGLNEDHAEFVGQPLSPTISPLAPRRLSCDPAADLVASPVATSPTLTRRSRHLEVPRSPHGSVSSDRSSALSLHSIPEGTEIEIHGEGESYPVVVGWDTAKGSRAGAAGSCSSDESDVVVMKGSASKVPRAAQKEELRPLDPGSKPYFSGVSKVSGNDKK